MSEVCCKRCGAADHMKNGIVRDVQRYLCRSCGCDFTMTPPRGKPPAMKALAMLSMQWAMSVFAPLRASSASVMSRF